MTEAQDNENNRLLDQHNRINVTSNTLEPSFYAQEVKKEESKKNLVKWIIIGGIALVAIILIIVLSCTLPNKDEGGVYPLDPPIPAPIPNPALPSWYNGYTVGSSVVGEATYTGFITSGAYNAVHHSKALTKLYQGLEVGANHNLGINPRSIPVGPNNEYIRNISFMFGMQSFKVGVLRMTDANNERYYVPPQAVANSYIDTSMRLDMLGFQLNANPFSFSFTDVTNKDNVFLHTQNSSLVFMDKYIQMDIQLPSQRVYGFGERVHEFTLGEGTWTMWAKGQDSPYDDGTGGKQVYGVHPFVLIQGKNKGDFFGLFFRNSNAQSPLLRFNDDGGSTLSYITTGGQIEVYFFIHGTAKEVIASYHSIIGNPNLPPFWSLGWQQASWKYLTQDAVQQVVQNYADAGMPLETIYLDIPYMNNYEDFTVDTVNFPDLVTFGEKIHANNQKLVVIIDAGISADDPNNQYYKMAQELQTLIMSSMNPDEFQGAISQKVWANHTVFLDWFNSNASLVWYKGLQDLWNLVPYDGLWIDMNEATGFCSGECPNFKSDASESLVEALLRELTEQEQNIKLNSDQGNDTAWFSGYTDQSQESTYFLPFIPGFRNGGNLDNMSLSLNATHPSINEIEYNVHSLYGLMMAKTTHGFMTSNTTEWAYADNRPFLLSRSTFAGSGQFTSHWLGDNWRDWNYLKYSIAGIMNMNMYGITQAGADVCGFFGEKKDNEMCARWIQLATFYPLARAHQNLTYKGGDSEYSEPYTLDEPWKSIARDSLFDRYQYLRHIYTCLFETSQFGGTCIDPLFYHYPNDDELYVNVEASFMVGGALKVSPILEPGVGVTDSFTSYFPEGLWVNMADFSQIVGSSQGGNQTLTAQNTVNVHLRPGSMVGIQNNSEHQYNSTTDLIFKAPISLVFNRDENGFAEGSLLLDNGTSREEISTSQYEYLKFQFSSNSINKFFHQGTIKSQNYSLNHVIVVNAVDLRNTDFACYMDSEMTPTNMSIMYDATKKALYLYSANPLVNITFDDFKTIHFGNSRKDVDLCGQTTYSYRLTGGMIPDLTGNNATFALTNRAGNLPDITVKLQMIEPTIVNIKWTFTSIPSGDRVPYEVPTSIINPTISSKGSSLQTFVTITDEPFLLSINSIDGTKVIDIYGLVYDSWLNIIQTRVFEETDGFSGIFGLGERITTDASYQDGVYSMWSKDIPSPFETGQVPGNNIYGTHPFYMFKTAASIWTGVFTNLANAQDWYVKNNPYEGYVNVTAMSVGGVADIYVIIGYNPKQVASDYQNYIIGKPVLIPVYALGWNQCRWGYKTTQDLYNVIDSYSAHNIPLDNQWSDIDYLQAYRDFTIDQQRYSDLPKFVNMLHQNGMHYVPILDAGISMRPWGNYSAYDKAVEQDIFIKTNSDQPTLDIIGNVWPNEANYPDWLNPQTPVWWLDQLQTLWEELSFDGLWLDMNEASNFCAGPCTASQAAKVSVLTNLKYVPTNRDLMFKSISVDALHYRNVLEFDVHSLFGTIQVMHSSQFFVNNNKRTFIIERSSYAGMGKYGSKWLGDNFSDIKYLEASIAGAMMMGMYGIPLAGADICGLIGDTTPELCARWTVVGAFYPFSRNHNNNGSISQEPYQFANDRYEEGVSFTDIMRQGIRNKYHLIKYYYTHFFLASTDGTGPFFNPLFFEFPDDANAFSDIQYNIMLGSSLKLSVNTNRLEQNSTKFYFPKGTWCNVYNASELCFSSTKGVFKEMRTKAYDFYVHLYQGNVVPMQNATLLNINTTKQLQSHAVDFHVLGAADKMGSSWYAAGSYVNDDGETATIKGNYNQYSIAVMGDTDSVVMQLTQYYTAYNYKDKVWSGCSGVNMNDLLGDIYIYNAANYNIVNTLAVSVHAADGTIYDIANADYDVDTDRLIFRMPALKEVCLTAVKSIVFAKAQ